MLICGLLNDQEHMRDGGGRYWPKEDQRYNKQEYAPVWGCA